MRAKDNYNTGKIENLPSDVKEWELISRSESQFLSVRDLRTYFDTPNGRVKAVDGVSFEIQEGEILGIVGESGSGKSVTGLSILGLVDEPGNIAGGEIKFREKNILNNSDEEMRQLRGSEIAFVPQEPMSALNPTFPIGWQVGEPLRIHHDIGKQDSIKRAAELMERVGIPSAYDRVYDYPHEFSGGMLQRAAIAMSLACEPSLLIADEPTTALDVTVQAQILNVLKDINKKNNMSILIISHNLGVIAEICDRVAVMYAGRIVEYGDIVELFDNPSHPYTKGLFNAMIDADTDDVKPIQGEVPDLINMPNGCNFQARCPFETKECSEVDPRLRKVDENQFSACIWRNHE